MKVDWGLALTIFLALLAIVLVQRTILKPRYISAAAAPPQTEADYIQLFYPNVLTLG